MRLYLLHFDVIVRDFSTVAFCTFARCRRLMPSQQPLDLARVKCQSERVCLPVRAVTSQLVAPAVTAIREEVVKPHTHRVSALSKY